MMNSATSPRLIYKIVPSDTNGKADFFRYFLEEEKAIKFLNEMQCLEGSFKVIAEWFYPR